MAKETCDGSPPRENGPWDKGRLCAVFRGVMLVVLFAWALGNLDAVVRFLGELLSLFSPFLLGGGIAFLINVVLEPLERFWYRKFKTLQKPARPLCLTVSVLLVLGILFAVVFMMLPSLQESADEFLRSVPGYLEELGHWWAEIVRFAEKYNVILPEYALNLDLPVEKIRSFINNEVGGIITVTWSAATSILSGVVDVLLAFVFSVYLLARKEAVGAHLKRLTEILFPGRKAQRLLRIASLTNQTFTNFVSGQLMEAVIIGVLCFFGMLLLRIPYAGTVSAFVAVTALVPIFGAWLGGGLGTLLILLAEPGKAVWFVVFLLLLQQVEGNLIYPKVVGRSVGLPGLLVLMAVTLGGEAFGILGMLLGVPVCAVAYSLYLEFLKTRPAAG